MQIASDESPLHNVEEVEIVFIKDDANRLLKKGWILLSVGHGQEQTGQHDYTPCFAYCLGKIRARIF